MIEGALPYLRCPVCEQTLRLDLKTLRCPQGHTFDLAKQGYANLTTGRMPYAGDTAEMIADRDDFLRAGHYDFIADALAAYAPSDGLVVDAGTGTGHYLARVLEAGTTTTGLGLDVSKPALRRAARSHPRAAAVLADLWRPLPIMDGAAQVILDVFAPRNGAEFRRVLRPDGVLLVATPAPDHLGELIEAYGLIHVDPEKEMRVAGSLGEHFIANGSETLRRTLKLTAGEARTLIGMTPSAHHLTKRPDQPEIVTAAVTLTEYRPRKP